jgi:hypothetical protein
MDHLLRFHHACYTPVRSQDCCSFAEIGKKLRRIPSFEKTAGGFSRYPRRLPGTTVALKPRGKPLMANRRGIRRKRHRHIGWCLLLVLIVHFLSLCTLSPQVHADLLSQAARAHHISVGHCTRPSSAPELPNPFSPAQNSSTTPAQRSGTIPVCCALMLMHRATTVSPMQIGIPYFSLLLPLSPKVTPLAEAIQAFHPAFALHSFHSPPLYLLHTALLV